MTLLSPQGAEPVRPRPTAVPDRNSQLRFLLIEDSAADSEMVRTLLEEEFPHGNVDVASSLKLALRFLAESDYDLIIVDRSLPDAVGRVVVRTVRGDFPDTALMVLTGQVDGSLAMWSLSVGARDCLLVSEQDGSPLGEAVLRGLHRSRTEQVARTHLAAALKLESEATEQLRAVEAAKIDFVATASHELRTPLTSIAAYAEMLEDEVGLTTSQTEFVAAIVRNAARLTALTEDLLLLSGFGSAHQQIEMFEVDLRALVSQAARTVDKLLTGRGLEVSYELPDEPVLVTGDPQRLERVVVNLMSNAIKFTEDEGTVTCRLSTSPTGVFLAVTDTGIGIPVDEHEHLFEKFFRGSGAHEGAVQGTGLGLHIVASIVGDHGGDTSVVSSAGQGATFTVRLPAAAVAGSGPTPHLVAETLLARFVAIMALPGADPEVDDIAFMLEAALEAAQQTNQWELLDDALRFAHGRLEVRGLTDAGLGDIGAALVHAAGPRLVPAERSRVHDLLAAVPPVEPLARPRDAGPGLLGTAYLKCLLKGDRTGAVTLARRCVSNGMDASEVLLDILEPAQREVGRRWSSGLISVAQEHFCSAVTQFVMTDLYAATMTGRESGRRLVAVHAPGSLHRIGLRMVADILEGRGWGTTYVGDDISMDALLALLAEEKSDLLLISASMPDQIPCVGEMIRAVRHDVRTRGVKVAVGGRPFLVAPDLVTAVGADGWASDAGSAVDVCDELTGGRG